LKKRATVNEKLLLDAPRLVFLGKALVCVGLSRVLIVFPG
jgi:hypothetical protein